MFIKIIKFAAIAFGIFELADWFGSACAALGYYQGEQHTLSTLKRLDEMSDGMSKSYISECMDTTDGDKNPVTPISKINKNYIFKGNKKINRMIKVIENSKDNYTSKYTNVNYDDNQDIELLHQRLLWRQFDKLEMQGIKNTLCFEIYETDVKLDREIIFRLAIKYNLVYCINKDGIGRDHVIVLRGFKENIDLFRENFWAEYNMVALDHDIPGLPIGRYTFDMFDEE